MEIPSPQLYQIRTEEAMTSDEKPQTAYEIVLADLRAKRDQIDQAIAAIEAIGGVAATAVGRPPSVSGVGVQPGMFHGSTIADAARKVLEIHKRQLTTREILDDIVRGGVHLTSAAPLNTIQTVLGRQTDIIKVKRGTWGLASWYPNSGRFRRTKGVGYDHDESSKGQSGPETAEEASEDDLSQLGQSPTLKVVS